MTKDYMFETPETKANTERKTYRTEFERIDDFTDRLRVPGGWFVRTTACSLRGISAHSLFFPDYHHEWELTGGSNESQD